ncbi:MAG: hypothetical protein K2H46_01535 [Muribaculaceae bacterium]|nr:hypothetical protein [Muribaculaceae bacterium]
MSEKEMRLKVEAMVAELRMKIERDVPEEGDFQMVYSEFKNTDRSMCLTDIMLKFRPIPNYLTDHETKRYLELVGYKLPVPFKATHVILRCTKEEVLRYLMLPEATDKILDLIPQLDFNLSDV